MNESNILIENKTYSIGEIERVLPYYIIEKYATEQKWGLAFNFCGFISSGDNIYAVMPKSYIVNSNTVIHDAQILFKTINRYRTETTRVDKYEEYLLGEVGDSSNILSSSYYLLDDYAKYGLISRKYNSTLINSKGPVNWSKTIASLFPVYQNGNLIHFDTYNRYSSINIDAIVKIHSYIINDCIIKFGWLIAPNLSDSSLEKVKPYDDSTMLAIINSELLKSYADKDIRLLLFLKQYIEGCTDIEQNDKISTFATPYFNIIWEKACQNMFRYDKSKFTDKIPKAKWLIYNRCHTREQIPDIISLYNNEYFIIDAKYYDTKNNLPGWHDIVKQFFYKETLINEGEIKFNVMIFPKILINCLEYIGYAELETSMFGKIYAVTGNMMFFLECYANYFSMDISDDLKKIII